MPQSIVLVLVLVTSAENGGLSQQRHLKSQHEKRALPDAAKALQFVGWTRSWLNSMHYIS